MDQRMTGSEANRHEGVSRPARTLFPVVYSPVSA
jgi:hypothetical protein